jgi:photosystem II stability/assembly factor-like uncharacterized protein
MRSYGLFLIFLFLRGSLIGQSGTDIQEMVNAVNRDSLLSYVERLQTFGTRYEYTSQRDSAAEYILSRFSDWGLHAESDRYSFGTYRFWDADLLTKDSLWVVGEKGLLLFSSDGGTTWTIQPSSTGGATFFGIDMQSNGFGVTVGSLGTIIRTTNAGNDWMPVDFSSLSQLYSVSFGSPTNGVIVGTDGTILHTTNAGVSWIPFETGTRRLLRDVQFISPTTVIAVGDSGIIFRSTDAGETWKMMPSGGVNYLLSVSFIDSLHGFVCGSGPIVLKTQNGGSTWTRLDFPQTQSDMLRGIFFSDSLHGCVIEYNARFFSTSNGGETWQLSDSVISTPWGPYFDKLRGIAGQRMIVPGSRSLIYTSADNGASWYDYSETLPSFVFQASRNIVASIPGSTTPEKECVLVAHYDSYSSNPFIAAPGANDNATGTAAVMEAARILSKYRFASTVKLVTVSAEEMGMYGSEHYAFSAKKENRNIVGAVNADMLGYPIDGDTLRIIAGSYMNRNRLVDSAVSYNERYGIGLNLIPILDNTGASDYGSFAIIGYDALELAEGTADEIWGGADPFYHSSGDLASTLNFGLVRRAAQLMLATGAEMAGTLGKDEYAGNGQPKDFRLYQNYPNPFNPTTTIKFQIPKSNYVTIKIFDMLGREVATLVDGVREAGHYNVNWNAEHFSSGVYIYRLQTEKFRQSKKLVLLR